MYCSAGSIPATSTNLKLNKMIKLLNFIIKIIASFLVLLMFYINVIIIILFWDVNMMGKMELMDMIWKSKDEEK